MGVRHREEMDRESELDSLIDNLIDLSVSDEHVDEYDMRSLFSRVSDNERLKCLRSLDLIAGVEQLLRSRSYVPSIDRNFLVEISENLQSYES
jgi:hypothetical protein